MKPGLSLLLIAGLLGAAEASTILVQDNFNDLGTANLDDSEPSTNGTGIAGLAWSASTTVATASVMKGNGEGGISFTTSTQTAGFHLGEGYFTANPGIYQLSMDITYPASLPATPNSWIGLGFSQGLNTEQNLTHDSNNGGP